MRAERQWQRAREVSELARRQGALVPLDTRLLPIPGMEPFVLRELLSSTPRHLRQGGPRPNPFLPWDRPLQVDLLEPAHVLLLNKYPVQEAHLLVITRDWHPQGGWIASCDWQAVAQVGRDTGGLWFFNSGARSGASQPHRHLQLLPRRPGEPSCPLAPLFLEQLETGEAAWSWASASAAAAILWAAPIWRICTTPTPGTWSWGNRAVTASPCTPTTCCSTTTGS